MTLTAWIVLVGAVLFSLFLSVVHFTLRSPSRVRLEEAFAGPRRERRLAALDQRLDEMVLVTAVLRTICHLLILLAIVELLNPGQHWLADLLALVLAAVVVALTGIGIPHAWAKYAGERTVAGIWPVLAAMLWALWPLAKALSALDVPVRRLSGHPEDQGRTNDVEQEILQLASEGQAEGGLDPGEMEMITSVIEFHDIRVGEIMTPRTDIEALDVSTPRDGCIQTVIRVGHSRIPVYQNTLDNVVGVLYAKDLLATDGADGFDLRRIMREPLFVPETKPISDLLKELKTRKVHIAIVLDEYGGTAGLVTIEDLLEELVGEIADEYEPTEPDMLHRLDDRTVEVDARMYIDDLNDKLKLTLPEEEDYDTVGGFVFSTLGYIPKTGETFDYADMRFTILDAEPRRVKRLRLRLPEQPPPPQE